MPIPWRSAVALALVLLAVSCDPADPSASVMPFAQFVHGLESARYADYAGRPGVAVRDERSFEQMRQYLLGRYRQARVVSSYASGDAVIDCVSMPAAGSAAPASPPPGSPSHSTPIPPGETPGTAAAVQQGHGCPPGAVPVRRVTLDQLVRFPTLRSFFAKGPGDVGFPPPQSP